MSLLSKLSSESSWEDFLKYKQDRTAQQSRLERVIGEKSYIPVSKAIAEGKPFPLPRRAVISKLSSQKKRIVYIYPESENTVLKLLTYLLLRKYDGLFSDGLYSFRPKVTAKDAVRRLRRIPGIERMWSYKVDISNYFNSVPVERFLPILEDALADDPELCVFLSGLLLEPRVLEWAGKAQDLDEEDPGETVPENYRIVVEQKGIMAGTPLSAFYANLYLKDMDRYFEDAGVLYARYSDDIIVFADSEAEVRMRAEEIKRFLAEKGLGVNPKKEELRAPEEGWTFLGLSQNNGVTDIAPATIIKLKGKMRRKARALARWRDRGGHSGEQAAAAFIRIFNRKLLGISEKKEESEGDDHELTWSRWFFPLINTVESLQLIDSYAQDQLRFLISGSRSKGRFNVRYEDLKALGYRSLVHEYYSFEE